MMTQDQTEVLNLLVRGSVSEDSGLSPDVDAEAAVEVLTRTAQTQPKFLIEAIRDVVQIRVDGMVIIALAYLSAKAPDEFLAKRGTQVYIMNMLSVYDPPALLEYVEMLRSKELGRGFGVRPQKWVLDVMQAWRVETLKDYARDFPKELCSLVRVVHPKYTGAKGDVIKMALQMDKFGPVC